MLLSFFTLNVSLFSFSSCEDMMTIETGDKQYTNANDTLYSYLGIMRAVQDVAERQVILGEIRGDLVAATEYATDTLHAISNFDNPQDQSCSMLQVSDYYNIINNCNFYISNCDTNTVKANIKYMIPEYTQVKAIRAWAYLQLVKNYKQVPYITEPVTNLSVVNNFDYNNNYVNKSNLIDKFKEDGLFDMVDTRYPQYGNAANPYGRWATGAGNVSARLCFVPIRVVLADAYLLRGQDQSDYENAARYYYEFLKKEEEPLAKEYCSARKTLTELSTTPNGGWGRWANVMIDNAEVVTTIPSAANAGLGKTLTRVAEIFGYMTESTQYTSEDTERKDDGELEGKGTYTTGGNISITPTYKRQYAPSYAFDDVNNDQTYVVYTETNGDMLMSTYQNVDARHDESIYSYTYDGEGYPLCAKAAKGSQFYYCIPVYRKTLIWLRLAEAINRAGYPEFAFAILKDGLNSESLPTIAQRVVYTDRVREINGKYYYAKVHIDTNDTVFVDTTSTEEMMYYDAEGNFVPYTGTLTTKYRTEQDTTRFKEIDYGTYGAMYYVTDSTRLKNFNAFLDFNDDAWIATYGIHARGTGMGSWTSATNSKAISTNISGYRDTLYYDYSKLLKAQNVDIKTASQDDIINGVENIIVNELALETAFEGNRFYDLVRIAEHKNSSGYKGTEWLAKKIANRGTKKATPESFAVDGYDAALYTKLLNQDNWYFALPAIK